MHLAEAWIKITCRCPLESPVFPRLLDRSRSDEKEINYDSAPGDRQRVKSGAPGDRQRAKVKVPNRKGIANQTGSESCVAHREVRDEALTGEPAGQPSSRENTPTLGCRRCHSMRKATRTGRDSASACSTLRGLRPWHVGTLFCRRTGRSPAWPPELFSERSASGRRGVKADDERVGEVRPLHSSDETGEQTRPTGRGAGGARKRTEGTQESRHTRRTQSREKCVPEARLRTPELLVGFAVDRQRWEPGA